MNPSNITPILKNNAEIPHVFKELYVEIISEKTPVKSTKKTVNFSKASPEIIPALRPEPAELERPNNLDFVKKKPRKLKHVDSKILTLDREYNQPPPYGAQFGGQARQTRGTPSDPDIIYRGGNVGNTGVYVDSSGRQVPMNSGRAYVVQDQEEWSDLDFDTTQVRHQFVRKVYAILSVQLIITFTFVFVATHVVDVRFFVRSNLIALLCFAIPAMPLYCILACVKSARRSFPCNFILLFFLTICMSYITGFLSCSYKLKAVYMAFGGTIIIVVVATLFAIQTRWDITNWGSILYIITISMVLFSMIIGLFAGLMSRENFKIIEMVLSGLTAALFGVWLMYDTQMICGGRRQEISPEEYILGAVLLYIDIIIIFQHMLRLFGLCQED